MHQEPPAPAPPTTHHTVVSWKDQFPVLSVAGGLHWLSLPHSHQGHHHGLLLLVPHDPLQPGVDLQEEVQHGVLVVSPILTIILMCDVMIIIVLMMFDTNDLTRPYPRC